MELLELILSFFFECFMTGFVETMADIVLRVFEFGSSPGSWSEYESRRNKKPSPLLTLLWYTIIASALAYGSVLLFPKHLIHNEFMRTINLVTTPVLIGFIMRGHGRRLEKKDLPAIRLDSFWYGFAFALTFALVRFFLAD